MKNLPSEIVHFLQNQNYLIVSTVDQNGDLHAACKGLVEIDQNGTVYLLDLYRGRTYQNLVRNPHISITAVDEHKFRGYSCIGTAAIMPAEALKPHTIKAWEDKITSRITQRVIRNITQSGGHPRHPEAQLPKPAYMIAAQIHEIIDLTPHHLRTPGT
ncbi:MAG TPA: pyridoxamine 5'-phosphate oxidase family protein [Patescibacteria group bacterium]|nr:pyridoxamine 5'-phosphate oxidase family protein [Patescibacteria group bacterium]